MIAALYVERGGQYFTMSDVDPWGVERDARTYDGPYPVVAHPPCERWGRYWGGGPSASRRRELGDDGGCFTAALAAVRKFGGVLEHPEGSHAFAAHGIARPAWRVGWMDAGDGLGYVCCVAQGNYGHRARKLTWLYVVGTTLPVLDWTIPGPRARIDQGFHSRAERIACDGRERTRTECDRLNKSERAATPPAFARWLVDIAKTAWLFGG